MYWPLNSNHSPDNGPSNGHRNRPWSRTAIPVAIRAIIDATSVMVGFAVGHAVHFGAVVAGLLPPPPPERPAYLALGALFAVITVVIFWMLGLYRTKSSVLNLWESSRTVRGIVLASAFFLAVLFVIKITTISRVNIAVSLGATLVFVIVARRVVAFLFRNVAGWTIRDRRTLIAGCGTMGRLLMKKIIAAPHTDRYVVGFVDDRVPAGHEITCYDDQTTNRIVSRQVIGRIGQLAEILHRSRVDELLVDEASIEARDLPRVLEVAASAGVEVGIVPEFGDYRADQLYLEDLSAVPVLRPHRERRRLAYRVGKRILDVMGTLALLMAVSPLMGLAALLIRFGCSGSIFFSQERVGFNGELFKIHKFRTMREETEPYAFSPTDDRDPRITGVGRILRTSGFDELPQLWNVLRGEMSLVGPRPEMPFIVERYTPLQRQRLSVKPGITGIWQLSPDRNAQIHENIEYDFFYINNQTLFLDLLILVETIFSTVGMLARRLRGRSTRKVREREERVTEQLAPEQLAPGQLVREQLVREQLVPGQRVPEQLVPKRIITTSR